MSSMLGRHGRGAALHTSRCDRGARAGDWGCGAKRGTGQGEEARRGGWARQAGNQAAGGGGSWLWFAPLHVPADTARRLVMACAILVEKRQGAGFAEFARAIIVVDRCL